VVVRKTLSAFVTQGRSCYGENAARPSSRFMLLPVKSTGRCDSALRPARNLRWKPRQPAIPPFGTWPSFHSS